MGETQAIGRRFLKPTRRTWRHQCRLDVQAHRASAQPAQCLPGRNRRVRAGPRCGAYRIGSGILAADTSPLMQGYLRTMFLRSARCADWYTNLAAGYVARAGPTIAGIVGRKSQKQFRPVDEPWLAIPCGIRISEMMLDLTGVDDFEAVPDLSAFAFVLAYTGSYNWRRGRAWRKLAGECNRRQGRRAPCAAAC
jgi:hypothetical protein